MRFLYFSVVASSVFLSACAEQPKIATDTVDPITAAISGKSLVRDDAVFDVGSDGSLTGKGGPGMATEFKGAWAIRDGKWCRTFTEPASFAGTECQPADLGDGTITITGRAGPMVWQIQ